jgi:malate dehydrogenase
MIDSIILDKKMILPCSVYLEGEYGISGLFVGVPAKLGAAGVEEIVEFRLSEEERAQLQKSADSVRELIGVMGL